MSTDPLDITAGVPYGVLADLRAQCPVSTTVLRSYAQVTTNPKRRSRGHELIELRLGDCAFGKQVVPEVVRGLEEDERKVDLSSMSCSTQLFAAPTSRSNHRRVRR